MDAELGAEPDAERDAERDAELDAELDAESAMRSYPRDRSLRVNHLQALGTHNSYHLAPEVTIPPWSYSHAPLDEQLGQQGVRQFELDIYERDGELRVYHIERFDPETNCQTLRECLTVMSEWSARHPQHHPLLTLLEVKSIERSEAEIVNVLESLLRETWGEGRLLTPSAVKRDYQSLRAGLEAEGWPLLGEVRGTLLPVLHAGGALREALLSRSLNDRLLFPDAYGDLEAPFAAYHSINDPIQSEALIRRVVEAGHLVRTRSDVDSEQIRTLDTSRGDRALLIGAHWISTDYPRVPTADEYGFIIPGGSPSRCNPLTAPAECESSDIE